MKQILTRWFQKIFERERNNGKKLIPYEQDHLTGLPTSCFFREQFGRIFKEVSQKKGQLAVMFLDIDRFKRVNDTMGHTQGDNLLALVAERLRQALPKNTLLSRFGGDEFTVLLTGIKREDEVREIAQQLMNVFEEPFYIEMEHDIYLSLSIGVAMYPTGGSNPEELLKNASNALCWAKKDRYNYKFFSDSMSCHKSELLHLESGLRKALDRNEFKLYYQPLVDSITGKLVALEALIRWHHPKKGLLYPATFIPIAEESGLIIPISEWVIGEACGQNQEWKKMGYESVPISVNLSASHFRDQDLVEYIRRVLQRTGLPSHFLELEITESINMHHIDSIIHTLHELDRLGIRIAIDDFGTGYSSLSYLRHFPINSLKIDRTFVQDIADGDGTLASTVITLAHQLNLKVTAEGVENATQEEYLKKHNCDRMQGFLFGKPSPPEIIQKQYLMKT